MEKPAQTSGSDASLATKMKKVIVIEDQTILRDLICQLVEGYAGMKVIAESGDGAEGYELCLEHSPDLVILDIMLPNLNGSEVLRRLKSKNPKANILIFSAAASNSMVNRLLKSGVTGYIEKDAGLVELEKAIALVSEGRSYFSPRIVEAMRELMVNGGQDDSLDSLTTREREIVQLIAESYSNKEIAAKLGMSVRTADTHRTNIMKKLNLHDVAALTRWAIANKLVDPTGGDVSTADM
ncbi:response regulator [Coraliomargarita akajimensis]|uniref:Two component transcriptional regulator, LuxR family n=1 Tax=Coraliomargarita akajimensis (strain DSM 45221 / IAM 15411 / JCM 23193 / KCTC 12865 / 04OKA010-24) TaxID=583355 RepID=D5EJ97_CORAD|nr:response regulator transcription factor [Coraliomargarita akajimensis]ADE54496.1 two component transcriptional regulator, LuxR family [Coraliomargarita akajimensis DSM 45221]